MHRRIQGLAGSQSAGDRRHTVFAEMKDPVRTKIERYELTETINPAHFFPTLDAAAAEFARKTATPWRCPEPRS